MKTPWCYLVGLIAGAILALAFFIGLLYLQLGRPSGSSAWAAAMYQKKQTHANSLPGRRLFLVAGSSTLLGLSAETIEQATGITTINWGTHAGLSIDYLLYKTKQVLRPGDIVLLAFEYGLYVMPLETEVRDDYILSRDPDYFYRLPWYEKIRMATRVPFKRSQHLYKAWRKKEIPESSTDHMNPHGDEITNTRNKRRPAAPQMFLDDIALTAGIPSTHTPGFAATRDFIIWCQANRITVLATFPNTIYRPVYDQPNGQQAIKAITDFYLSQQVPVIGNARDAMLPADDFFDTHYHMTYESSLQRTDRLIPFLRPYLPPTK